MRLRDAFFEAFTLLFDGLRRLEALLLTLLLFGLMSLGLTQIVMRNLGIALPWADGVMRAMVLWLAMIAGVMAAGQLRHIRINLIEHWLPPRLVSWIHRLAYLITAGVCAVMFWYGLDMIGLEASFGTIAFLNVPTWLVQMIVPIGFALMTLRFVFIALSPNVPDPHADQAIVSSLDGSDDKYSAHLDTEGEAPPGKQS